MVFLLGRSLRLAISFVCALTLLASGAAQAATRYVDNSGSPACSNNSSLGTEAQPWCTINYGVTQLRSGDQLIVKRGTYNEDVYISGPAGTASANTIIRTYPGHVVTIRGTGNSGRVKITGTSYVTLDGFTVTNFNQGIFVEGASHHVTVQNCTVHDVGQEGIHVKENSSFVTVQGCTVYNTQILPGGCCNGEGVYVGTSSSGPMDNTHDVTVRNNIIHDVTDEGIEIKPGTYNCVVEGNELYRTNLNVPYAAIELDERDLSPQTWSGNPSHIVRNNLVHDNKNGIRLGTGSTAYNNIIYNTASGFAGILLDNVNSDSFTRFVYHNTIHMASNAVVVRSATADIRNNIGPTTSGNVAYSDSLFVDAASRNYHLRSSATVAINVGADLTSVVPVDRDGISRLTGGRPDLGAYELALAIPSAPTNVRIK